MKNNSIMPESHVFIELECLLIDFINIILCECNTSFDRLPSWLRIVPTMKHNAIFYSTL